MPLDHLSAWGSRGRRFIPEEAGPCQGDPLPITSSRMGHLCGTLPQAHRVLGFEHAAGGDEVFRDLVLARVIEPTSKLDSLRVLQEVGIDPPAYRTLTRRLRVFADPSWRQQLAAACAAHAGLGPASLVLYDVSTLYFETDAGDGFREPGFPKERRLDPQITIGLLTDAAGFAGRASERWSGPGAGSQACCGVRCGSVLRLVAMVAGDVLRRGQVQAERRMKTRSSTSSPTPRP